MSISLKKKIIKIDYHIDGNILERAAIHSDLSVTFDESLNFTNHIINKIANAYKTIGCIIRSTHHFDVDLCFRLFDALILPKLEYGCIIWSPQYIICNGSVEGIH